MKTMNLQENGLNATEVIVTATPMSLEAVLQELLLPRTKVMKSGQLFFNFKNLEGVVDNRIVVKSNGAKKVDDPDNAEGYLAISGKVRVGICLDADKDQWKMLLDTFFVDEEWATEDLLRTIENYADEILAVHQVSRVMHTDYDEVRKDDENVKVDVPQMNIPAVPVADVTVVNNDNAKGGIEMTNKTIEAEVKAALDALKANVNAPATAAPATTPTMTIAGQTIGVKASAGGVDHPVMRGQVDYAKYQEMGLLGGKAGTSYVKNDGAWYCNHSANAWTPGGKYMNLTVCQTPELLGFVDGPIFDRKSLSFAVRADGELVIAPALQVMEPSKRTMDRGFNFSVVWNQPGRGPIELPLDYTITERGLVLKLKNVRSTFKNDKDEDVFYYINSFSAAHEAYILAFAHNVVEQILKDMGELA